MDYQCVGPAAADACELSVRLELPRLSGTKRFRIGGFAAHTQVKIATTRLATGTDAGTGRWAVVAMAAATTDPHGVAEFEGAVGRGWRLEVAAT